MDGLACPDKAVIWVPPRAPKGGVAMSTFEILMLIFTAMTFIVVHIRLIVAMIDTFLNNKK